MRRKKAISVLCALAMVTNLFVGATAFAEETENYEAAGLLEPLDAGLSPLATSVTLADPSVSSVEVPGTDDVVNYLVLEVDDNSYADVTYAIDGTTVTPSLVLSESGTASLIKLEVPAGVVGAAVSVTTTGAASDLNTTVAIAEAGVQAPGLLYGTARMDFSEFFHDVTAGITDVQPATTSFATAGTVASPALFIAQGTRTGNLYANGITWASSKNYPAVDAVSTATFGDGGVHYSISKAVTTNYDDAINSTGEGHALTGIRAVDVGVNFDLLANATLLDELDEATTQSTAVLAKTGAIAWSDANSVYKVKYLFADASWGAREATAVSGSFVPKAFPSQTAPTTSYGGTWTIRQFTVNFDLATPGIGAEAFWDDYLEYIYGGYVENTNTGERQPLVWLQNLFSHRMHLNFDVSLNESIFPRFSSLNFPGTYKIVVYAQGFEDIVVDSASLASYANGGAAIEQGSTFNVSPTDKTTWFEDTADGYQLHIQGADRFDATTATLTKGSGATAEAVDISKYLLEQDGSEIALTFDESFFAGNYQGAYTLRLTADTSDVASKPVTFTVNRIVDWPTLSVEEGVQNISTANSESTPLSVPKNRKVTLSNADLAKTLLVSGRGTISSVYDLTADAAATTANVIKRDATSEPYYLDLSSLTVGHAYRVTLATTNYSVATSPVTYATTLNYYLTVGEAAGTSIALADPSVSSVEVPGTNNVVNYLVLEVDDNNYADVTYTVNGVTVVPSLVLSENGTASLIKLEVPAGAVGATVPVTTTGAISDLSTTVAIAAVGVAAPATIFGEVPMGFAEFNHFVTAGISAVTPTDTSFVAGAAVAVPEQFIAAGGRTNWPISGSQQPSVDVISTATYGDSVHYVPSENLTLNYADPQTKADGNAVTGVKAAEVGISFDLLANATLLDAADEATDQSAAVLEKADALIPKAETTIYKAQYLFADASWGAREDTPHNTNVAAAWKPTTTISTLYGNNWTIREAQINFDLGSTSGADFWDDYLEYLYGGYIENTDTGAREPLVFLQNIFTHRGHTNIDVSINNALFPRFDGLGIPDDNFKIVLYAKGFEDIVVPGVALKDYVDGSTVIEQGATFNVKPGDSSTWFEGNALHIQGVDAAKRDAYAASATLSKGNAAVNPGLYSFNNTNDELELSVENAFFTGAYQGSYTITLTPETATEVSKPLTFTVNKWLDRPTLSTATGTPSAADSEENALVATLEDTVSFSSSEYANAIATSGRTVSSIVDVTANNASVTASNVLKRELSTDPYALDLSTLTVGHTYRLTLITTNIATGTTPSTTATYYLTVGEDTTEEPGDEDVSITDPATNITVTASASIPLDQLKITPISSLQTAGLSWLKHAQRDVAAAYDIHFDSYTLAAGETLTISFPIASSVAAEGKKLLVHHGYDTAAQRFETFEPAVSGGRIAITVSSLSPFVIHALAGETETETETDDETTTPNTDTGTDTGTTSPATGDTSLSLLPVLLLLVLVGSLLMLSAYLRRNTISYSGASPHKKRYATRYATPTPRRRVH
jgi:hypothetical protein